MEVHDRVVIVTGASAGIGLSTARRFAAEGARVALAARSADNLEQAARELRQQGYEAVALPADMTRKEQVNEMVEAVFQRYGRIDILVNNAGQAAAGTIADIDPDHFRQIIELNLFGVVYAMQAVIPKMRQNGGGMILNISSMVSKMHIPGLSTYAATKAALNLISDTARLELQADNIRVITVYPRLTATDFGKNSLGSRTLRREQRSGSPITPDPPELVAEKILQAVRDEPEEQFMD